MLNFSHVQLQEKTAAFTTLRDESAQVAQELVTVKETNAVLELQLAATKELTEENLEMKTKLEQVCTELEKWPDALSAKEAEISALHQQLQESESALSQFHVGVDTESKKLQDCELRLAEKEMQLQQLSEQLKQQKAEKDAKIVELFGSIEEFQHQLNHLSEVKEVLAEEKDRVVEERDKIAEERDKILADKNKVVEEKEKISEGKVQVEEELSSLQTQIAQISLEEQERKQLVEHLQIENVCINAHANEASARADKAERMIQETLEEKLVLQDEVSQSNSRISELETMCDTYRAREQAMGEKQNKITADFEKLQKEHKELAQTEANERAALQKFQLDRDSMQDKLFEETEKVTFSKQQFSLVCGALKDSKVSVAQLIEQAARLKQEKEELNKRLISKEEQIQTLIQEKEEELQHLKQELMEMQSYANDKKQELKETQSQLGFKEALLETGKAKLEETMQILLGYTLCIISQKQNQKFRPVLSKLSIFQTNKCFSSHTSEQVCTSI